MSFKPSRGNLNRLFANMLITGSVLSAICYFPMRSAEKKRHAHSWARLDEAEAEADRVNRKFIQEWKGSSVSFVQPE